MSIVRPRTSADHAVASRDPDPDIYGASGPQVPARDPPVPSLVLSLHKGISPGGLEARHRRAAKGGE